MHANGNIQNLYGCTYIILKRQNLIKSLYLIINILNPREQQTSQGEKSKLGKNTQEK